MTKEKLTQLVDMAGFHAKLVMIKLQMQLIPSWILINQRGACDVIGTPWRNEAEKNLIAERMRRKMRKEKTIAYSLVVEAWAAVAPKGWQPGEPRTPNWMNPERREVVIAFATDGKQTEWRQWETKRNHLEQVTALEPIDFDGAQAASWMRFVLVFQH